MQSHSVLALTCIPFFWFKVLVLIIADYGGIIFPAIWRVDTEIRFITMHVDPKC